MRYGSVGLEMVRKITERLLKRDVLEGVRVMLLEDCSCGLLLSLVLLFGKVDSNEFSTFSVEF